MKTPKRRWQCGECLNTYADESSAQECCMPEVFDGYECPICEEFCEELSEAETCCQPPGSQVVEGTRCALCSASPLTAEDVSDSQVVGSLPRCRPCILAVAPE